MVTRTFGRLLVLPEWWHWAGQFSCPFLELVGLCSSPVLLESLALCPWRAVQVPFHLFGEKKRELLKCKKLERLLNRVQTQVVFT